MSEITLKEKLYEIYSRGNGEISAANSHLKGVLFTLIDACFTDAQQRKAFKDLVSQEVDKAFYAGARDILVGIFKEVGKVTGCEIFMDSTPIVPSSK